MTNDDLTRVPTWLTDPNEIAPCPCGGLMAGPIAVIESDNGFRTGYHPRCLWRRADHEESDEDIEWE